MQHRFLIAMTVVCVMAGCRNGPPDLPKLYHVVATVTMNDQPLEEATIACYPEDGGKWFSGGMTDASGQVRFKTRGRYDGIPLGRYKVVVIKSAPAPGSTPESHKMFRIVHSRFQDAQTTPLSCEITKESKSLEFKVEPAPPRDSTGD